ncbi:hypothetical protein HK101_004768 [Irineochytrium annulatum]|nr:hypothetical protein HK101_004768 [Irineochytrium annulatum]
MYAQCHSPASRCTTAATVHHNESGVSFAGTNPSTASLMNLPDETLMLIASLTPNDADVLNLLSIARRVYSLSNSPAFAYFFMGRMLEQMKWADEAEAIAQMKFENADPRLAVAEASVATTLEAEDDTTIAQQWPDARRRNVRHE